MPKTVKGIKGQIKKHQRPKNTKLAIPAVGRKRARKDYGALTEHVCSTPGCGEVVLAPEKIYRVICGRCVVQMAGAVQAQTEAEEKAKKDRKSRSSKKIG